MTWLIKGYQRTELVSTRLKTFYGRHHDIVFPYNRAFSRTISDVFATDKPWAEFQNPEHTFDRFPVIFVQIDRHGERRMLTK